MMGLGNAVAGQQEVLMRPTGVPIQKNSYGLVLCHPHQATGLFAGWIEQFTFANRFAAALVRRGFPAITMAMDYDSWANDASMGDITSCIGYMSSVYGTHPTKALLVGESMGALAALRYAGRAATTANVAGILGLLPAIDLVGLYTANALGAQAVIGAAWGVTPPAVLPARADVYGGNSAANILAANIPVRFLYDGADTAALPTITRQFALNCGGQAIQTSNSFGHTDAALSAMDPEASGIWLDSLP